MLIASRSGRPPEICAPPARGPKKARRRVDLAGLEGAVLRAWRAGRDFAGLRQKRHAGLAGAYAHDQGRERLGAAKARHGQDQVAAGQVVLVHGGIEVPVVVDVGDGVRGAVKEQLLAGHAAHEPQGGSVVAHDGSPCACRVVGLGGQGSVVVAVDLDHAVFVDEHGPGREQVVHQMGGLLGHPVGEDLDLLTLGQADGVAVVQEALARAGNQRQAGVEHPGDAEPGAALGALEPGVAVAREVGALELADVEQLVPLVRAHHGETVAVVGHVAGVEPGKGLQDLGLGQAAGCLGHEVGALVEPGHDQLVDLAAQGVGPGVGHHKTLVGVGLELVELVHVVRAVPVFERGGDGGVGDVHERHVAVAGLLASGALAVLLEHGRGALDAGLEAHGVAQLAAALLVGLVHVGHVLGDEGVGDAYGHAILRKLGWQGLSGVPCASPRAVVL